MAMKREREREPHKKWNLAARMRPFNSPQWWFNEIYLGLANNGILLQYIYLLQVGDHTKLVCKQLKPWQLTMTIWDNVALAG